MPRAIVPANIGTVEIEYETLGSPLDPTILLIMGFTAQLIAWSDKFCQMLVDQGFHVIRFDNRDCGLSTKLDGVAADPMAVMSAFLENKPAPAVPYTLSDMALDAVGLLDHLGIDAAHIVGASMGGMIAQTLVIEHPHRARSLTSVMSVSGNLDYGAPTPEAAVVLLEAPTGDRQSYINDSVKARVWHSRRYFDEEKIKTDYARSYDRSFYPEGASRQLAAIYASGSREDALTKLAGQVFTAGILLLYGIQILWLPINGVITLPPSIGQLLTVLIVLVVINAVNFIDGMDGLAAGVVAISGIAFFAFAYLLAVDYGFSRAGAPSLITAVLIGICLGFLPHNLSPAKIFMGDSGSMLLGLLLSVSAITLTGQVDPNAISAEKLGPTLLPLLLPFAVLAIPFLDLLLAVSRRIKAGKSPFAPDNLHLHHRLLSAGNSTGQTVLIVYLWTATIAFPVTVLAFAPWWVAVLTALFFALSSGLVMKHKKKITA